MPLFRSLILTCARPKAVRRMVERWRLFRPLVRRFIAGDDLETALKASEDLAASGFLVTLDYLGENTKSGEEALAAIDKYVDMLRRIALSPHLERINISIKLTQCGLDQGDDFATDNFRRVLAVAQESGNFVRIDMEASEYTERTLAIMRSVWADFKNTGTVLQSYLHRTEADVEAMIALGMRIRMVKGAYLEPPTLAFQDKAEVDRLYVQESQRLLEAGNYPAVATHDPAIIEAIKRFAAEKGIAKDRFEFQFLYGIAREAQAALLKEGYRVRVYVPYGDAWYPYFTRRLAERPANLLFIFKALLKG